MIKIGLLGNIASGKSQVEKIFSDLNIKTIDLDTVSHNLYEKDEALQKEILKAFSTLDRKKIANIVFSKEEKKKELQDIFFPRLRKYVLDFFEENKKEKIAVVSGALLYEAGFFDLFDKTLYIDAPYEIRLSRLIERNSIEEKEAKKRLDCQKDTKEYANYVINNDKSLEELKKEVLKFLNSLDVMKF